MNKEHVFAYLEANLSLQHLSDAANKPASEDTCQECSRVKTVESPAPFPLSGFSFLPFFLTPSSLESCSNSQDLRI